MIKLIKRVVKKLPGINQVVAERDELKNRVEELKQEIKKKNEELEACQNELKVFTTIPWYAPPGHFLSPIPDFKAILNERDRIWGKMPDSIPGIDLNLEEQIGLVKEFKKYYDQLPFQDDCVEGLHYYMNNPSYGHSDGIFLYCVIRHCKPKRIIEVGCGFSSCVILDINQLFFDNKIECVFIDPYPQLLQKFMKTEDKSNVKIVEKKLQEVDLELFKKLEENDILFIDSTHVSKIDSDVNHLFFQILPILQKGVWVHIHDIAFPFEYPADWIEEGRVWNEQYLLRSFLQFNSAFKIKLFNTYLGVVKTEMLRENMPLVFNNMGGSIWIQRVN